MFYSYDLLRIRSSKKGRLPRCWIAATIKEFVGQGLPKLSKKDVVNFEVYAACNDILEKITTGNETDRLSLYLSAQLMYGSVRIFQKQVDFLLDDCEKMFTSIFIPKKTVRRKTANNKNNLDNDDGNQEFDPLQLFPSREDKYLITELEHNMIETNKIRFDFNDPVEPCDPNDIRSVPGFSQTLDGEEAFIGLQQLAESELRGNQDGVFQKSQSKINQEATFIAVQQQTTNLVSESVSDMVAPVTPKRKTNTSHNETPTKKKRTANKDELSDGEKTLSSSRFHLTSSLSETARSPAPSARRSIFTAAEPAIADEVPMQLDDLEVFQGAQGVIPGVVPMQVENVEVIAEPDNAIVNDVPMQEDNFENPAPIGEINVFMQDKTTEITSPAKRQKINDYSKSPYYSDDISDSIITKTTLPPPNSNNSGTINRIDDSPQAFIQLPSDKVIENEAQPTRIQLESNDEAILNNLENLPTSSDFSEKKKKRKKKLWSDVNKQIKIVYPADKDLHTKSVELTSVISNQKVPSKFLLKLPVVKMSASTVIISNICKWSKTLFLNFSDMINFPIQDIRDAAHDSPLRRDRFVNKLPRRSGFRRNTSSQKSLSNNSDSALQALSLRVEQNDNVMMHRSLTPVLLPRISNLDPISEMIDLPEQSHGILQNQELEPVSDVAILPEPAIAPASETLSDSFGTFLPRQVAAESMTVTTISESNLNYVTSSPKDEDSMMSREEFYELLLRLWEIVSSYIAEEEVIKIKLDDILSYENNSVQEVCHYIMYCFEFEKKHKLYLEQKRPYDTIFIIKLQDEQEEL